MREEKGLGKVLPGRRIFLPFFGFCWFFLLPLDDTYLSGCLSGDVS